MPSDTSEVSIGEDVLQDDRYFVSDLGEGGDGVLASGRVA
jgi:hypothetical protein